MAQVTAPGETLQSELRFVSDPSVSFVAAERGRVESAWTWRID